MSHDGFEIFFDVLSFSETPAETLTEISEQRPFKEFNYDMRSTLRFDFDQKVAFGLITKACRNMLNMGQLQFAKAVGLSKPTIARIETFETDAKPYMIEIITDYLANSGINVWFSDNGYQLQINPGIFIESYMHMLDKNKRRKDKKNKEKNQQEQPLDK